MLMLNIKNIPGFATVLPLNCGGRHVPDRLKMASNAMCHWKNSRLALSILDCAIMSTIKQENTLAWKIRSFCVPVDIEHIPPVIFPPSNCTTVAAMN